MNGRRLLGSLVGAMLTLCLARATPVGAQATTQTSTVRFTGSGTSFSPCTSEAISVNYAVYIEQHFTRTPSGTAHVEFGVHIEGQGIGETSGIKYVFSNSSRFNQDVSPNDQSAFVFDAEGSGILIATGEQTPADDQILHVNLHITITGNGDLTASVTHIFFTCQ